MKILVFFIVTLLACSCSQENHKSMGRSGDIKIIDLLSHSDSVIYDLSYLASDIRYVHLQTPSDISFGCIYKVVSFQDKIYVNGGDDLFCFDNSGHFLYCLSKHAKESYNFIYDFDISSDQKTVIILSNIRIFFFDNSDNKFTFLKSIKLNKPSPCKISFIPGSDKILLSMYPLKGTDRYLNVLINSNGDTLFLKRNYFKYILPFLPVSDMGTLQYKTDSCLCFKEQHNDTIFYINNKSDTITPKFILDPQGRTLLNWAKGTGEYFYHRMNPYSTIENIFEVSRYVIYTYSYHYPDENYALDHKIIYNKTTHKKLEINIKHDLKDDLCGGPDFYPVNVSGGKLYSWIYGFDLKKYLESESFKEDKVKNPTQKESFKKLTDSLKIRDIVLIVVTPN